MRKDVDLALALVRVREITQDLTDQGTVHLALFVAHLFVTDGEADITEPHLQLADHAQHRLATGRTGVLHRFNRLGLEAGHHRDEPGEQALLVERQVTGGADAGDIDRLRLGADLGAGLVDRVGHDLRHRHVEELPELGLVVRCYVNLFHCSSL